MQKLAKIIFLLTALNAVFVFGTRVDQGSTSEGTAFQSGTTTQCTSSAQTSGAPCLQYFFNGAQFGLVGTIESEQFGSNTFSGATDIYLFNAAFPVLFTPSSFTDLDNAEYGVANCGLTSNSNSNINIKSADGSVHVPCVSLTANGSTDSGIIETLNGSGGSILTYTGPTSALDNGQNIVFYVKYASLDPNKGLAEGSFSQVQTPEPASVLLFASGLGAFLTYRRRRS
jgi:hypothetical protein